MNKLFAVAALALSMAFVPALSQARSPYQSISPYFNDTFYAAPDSSSVQQIAIDHYFNGSFWYSKVTDSFFGDAFVEDETAYDGEVGLRIDYCVDWSYGDVDASVSVN